ncbi:MAG: M50 family metallopeptidase [Dehalococcoidales bacterium]|jgi:regulator of sigma E protease
MLTILAGLIVLSVLILVHELGHFITAKATGVLVEEFGIGFPPRLFGKKFGETIYSINWIPFGGFNKLSGEIDPNVPRALAAKNYGVRLLVLGGGILMNLLLPFVLLSVAYMVPHDIVVGEVVVQEVYPDSPASVAGIKPGDTIFSANDKPVNNTGDLSRYVILNQGKEISLSVRHSDATTETVKLTPRWKPPAGQTSTGTLSRTIDPKIVPESYPFWQAIPIGTQACIETLVLYKNGIIGMIIGTVPFVLTGAVGIVQATGEVAQAGISPVLEMAAVISIAIGVTQMIPFPALDGGRIIFVILELVRRGKRVSPKSEGIVHSVGFIILLALMVLITYQDIVRWVSGGSLLG